MAKFITAAQAAAYIPNGATVVFGGFLGCGSAHSIIDALVEADTKDLTVIANDCGMEKGPTGDLYGIAKLIRNRQVKRVIASHVGMTPDVAIQSMTDKFLEVNLVPQGSLAEMIRAGGAGLGGVLTPVGVGTIVEESPLCLGRQTIDGKDYLLMKSLRADFALINAAKIDKSGNMWYKGTTRNFNSIAALAANITLAEADEIVEVGAIEPENIVTPGALVDYIVEGSPLHGKIRN